MPIPSMNITNGCRVENAVTPVFQCKYVQSVQPVPSTKVQVSSMIAKTILMTYQLTGAYIQVHKAC